MSAVPYFQLKTQYNHWMNKRLYDLCQSLSDEERKRNLGAFFSSIHGTLNHILLADLLWLARLGLPVECKATSLSDILYEDFHQLTVARQEIDALLTNYIDTLTDADMSQLIQYKRLQSDDVNELPLGLILTHLFNHQTHHRGQLTTLITQVGLEVGVTDMISMPTATTFLTTKDS
ncbi:DinB family protein [Marinomonas shanghaiensis]|uniref:DinB family protein n=1 Tax=Marinomonas shanghaiensis TaxID=2202418 RepID=UPI000DB93837|nr:DinB family protein [Marinomonas shanghaiensis]